MWNFIQYVRSIFLVPCVSLGAVQPNNCVTKTGSFIFLLYLAFKVILNLKYNVQEAARNRHRKRGGVPLWSAAKTLCLLFKSCCELYVPALLYSHYTASNDCFLQYTVSECWCSCHLCFSHYPQEEEKYSTKQQNSPGDFKKSIFKSNFYSLPVHSSFSITVTWFEVTLDNGFMVSMLKNVKMLPHWKLHGCLFYSIFNFQYQGGEAKQEEQVSIYTSYIYNVVLL